MPCLSKYTTFAALQRLIFAITPLTLFDVGFVQGLSDTNVLKNNCKKNYKYVFLYVDDLMIKSMNPKKVFDIHININGYKLKGDSEHFYHLQSNDFIVIRIATLQGELRLTL